ncbi:MAG TPA: hypothetical protein VJC15_04025 [Candidatus Paceibacterota bacterium]
MKSKTIKEHAIAYRKQGYSYAMILDHIDVTQSTLSAWLRDIPFTPNGHVIKRISEARRQFIIQTQERALRAQSERRKIRDDAKSEISHITRENLWHIGTMLYLAEGAKKQRQIQISNSDPRVIKIAMRWLLEICKVPHKNIVASVHLYPDIEETKAIRYWSHITHLSKSQFQKTIIDTRQKISKFKHGTLPFGTLHIRVRQGGILFEKISGWIEGILEKIS